MDTRPSDHPTSETLQAYALGKLDDASAEAVNKHLEGCLDCRRLVAEIAPDSFLARLRDAQEGVERSTSPRTTDLPRPQAANALPETTAADDATIDRPPSPLMSATGQSEATSAASNGPDESALQPGTCIGYFGDYELIKVLGEGGMGIVYKARQLSLNRPVALKMIRAARFASSDEVRRFQNEAEAVARLDHPHIVPIFEVGRFEDQHYFSMKLIGGESLDKRLEEYVNDPRRAARLVLIAAGAVHHAHQRGILHRDLKPANILVDSDGAPHVTDFGLAKRIEGDSELTQSGALLGTPAYMAPEQASGKRGAVTIATDVYGLGAVLYALLTGRAPFGGATIPGTLEQVRERPPDSPRKLNPRMPRDLEVICLRCLEKDPRRRYANADALAEDLRRWLAGEPIEARPVGSTARFYMWCRRNPIVAGATGLVAASLVVVAVLSLLYASQQRRHANEQAEATTNISGLNKNLEKERQDLKTSLAESNRRLATIYFERSQIACEKGSIGPGLLWLVKSWRAAVEAGDKNWQRLARANLAGWQALLPKLKAVFSHQGPILAVAFSPDGRKILTGSADNTVQVWNVATCEPIGLPLTIECKINAVALYTDGSTALIGGQDKTARLWNAVAGQPLLPPLVHEGSVTDVAFSSNGKTILTVSEQSAVYLWNASNGKPIGVPLKHLPQVTAMALSPDGKTVLTASRDGTNRLWDSASGRPLGQPLTHRGELNAVAFSPDGRTALTGGLDNTARLWDAATSHSVGTPLTHQDPVRAVAFSSDGNTIITGCWHGTAQLWDRTTFSRVGVAMNHPEGIYRVAFSPDGKTVVTVGGPGPARLWDSASGLPIGPALYHEKGIRAISFSPDSKTLLTGCWDGTARLWDAAPGEIVGRPLRHRSSISSVAYSPDGKRFVTGSWDKTAQLWDAATCQPLGRPMMHPYIVAAVAFGPDNRTIVTGSFDKTAQLWDLKGRPIARLMAHSAGVVAVSFSPDGKTVLTGSVDNTARLWDTAIGRPVGQPLLHQGSVRGLAFSPDGKAILTGSDKGVMLWNAKTGEPVGPPLELPEGVSAVSFSPDGRTILTGSGDGKIRLWDTTSRRPIGSALKQATRVVAVSFSPDGRSILTGSEDKSVQLWDVATWKPLGPLLHFQGSQLNFQTHVSFSPDGKSIIVSCANEARVLEIADLPDDLPRISAWVEVATGLALDDEGKIHVLDGRTWRESRARLAQMGGPPDERLGTKLDPVLFGPEPTARARAWMERKRWSEAEIAFDEVVRARPFDSLVREERGRFYLARSQPEKAAADFAEALVLGHSEPALISLIASNPVLFDHTLRLLSGRAPEDRMHLADTLLGQGQLDRALDVIDRFTDLPPKSAGEMESRFWSGVRFALIGAWDRSAYEFESALKGGRNPSFYSVPEARSFVRAGDLANYRAVCAQVLSRLDREGPDGSARINNNVAWICALAPEASSDPAIAIRLAQQAIYSEPWANVHKTVLGASLYRAGMFKEAIRCLEEGIGKGRETPQDWVFLAMAHHQLGRTADARLWLKRARQWRPSRQSTSYWTNIDIQILRNEAEAVILYDPIFPADPFAH